MPSSGSHGIRNFSWLAAGPLNSNPQVGRPSPSTEPSRSQTGRVASHNAQAKRDRRRRVIAYYTHALVTFHTFGIPLSAGLTLEYYYNTLFFTTPLKSLALIFGIQWVGVFSMELLAVGTFKWKHWRWASIGVTVVVVLCHAVMARGARAWTLSLGMRASVGLCLGFLRSVTLRCLATHYNNDTARVSMQSGAAAMLGSIFYSLISWIFLRTDNYKKLAWVNFYIVLFGLTPALAGLFQATKLDNVEGEARKRDRSIPRLRHRKSTNTMQSPPKREATQANPALALIGNCVSLGGYFFLSAFAFVWPTFFPLLFTARPIYEYPDYATYWLFGLFSAATFTATLFARPWPRRGLGVVNSFTAAGILGGSLLLIAAWITNFWVWGVISVLYGLCLGPLLALHRKVFDLLCKYCTKARLFPVGLGVFAFGGVSLAGLMVQNYGGASVALTVAGSAMVVGGCCMAGGRWLQYPTKYVVI